MSYFGVVCELLRDGMVCLGCPISCVWVLCLVICLGSYVGYVGVMHEVYWGGT